MKIHHTIFHSAARRLARPGRRLVACLLAAAIVAAPGMGCRSTRAAPAAPSGRGFESGGGALSTPSGFDAMSQQMETMRTEHIDLLNTTP